MIQNKFSPIGKSALVAYEAGAKHKMLQEYPSDTNYGNLHYTQGCKIGNVYCYCTFHSSLTELHIHFSEGKEAPFHTEVITIPSTTYSGVYDNSFHITEHQGNFLVLARYDSDSLIRRVYSASATSGSASLVSNNDASGYSLSAIKSYFIELNGYVWMLSTNAFGTALNAVKSPNGFSVTALSTIIQTPTLQVTTISAVTSDNGSKNFFVVKDTDNDYCYGISLIDCDIDGTPTKFMPMVLNSYNRFSVDDDFDEYTTGAFTLTDDYIVDGYLTPDYRIDVLRQSDEEGLFYVRGLSEIVNVKRNSVSKEVTSFPNNPSIVDGQLLVEYQSAKSSSLEVKTLELEDSGEVTLKTFEQSSGSTLRLGKYTNIKGSPKEPMVIYGDGANVYSFLSAIEKSITETSGNYQEYSQGTWTPTFNVNPLDITYSKREGWWSKLGNTIHIGGIIEVAETSTTNPETLHIIDIPFDISTKNQEKYSTGVVIGDGHGVHFIFANSDKFVDELIFFEKQHSQIRDGETFYFQITYLTSEPQLIEDEVLVLTDGSTLLINSENVLTL